MTIFVRFGGDLELSVEEVWPDGDAPEVITAEAVKQAMENDGSRFAVLNEWMLIPTVNVSVDLEKEVEVWG